MRARFFFFGRCAWGHLLFVLLINAVGSDTKRFFVRLCAELDVTPETLNAVLPSPNKAVLTRVCVCAFADRRSVYDDYECIDRS